MSLVSVVPIKCSSSGCVLLLFSVCRHLSNGDLCTESCKLRRFGFRNCRVFRLFNARSLKSVLVLLAQILGPFGPLKKRVNFDMFKKTSKVRTLYFVPQSLNQKKLLLSYCVLSLNFVCPPSCMVP